MGQRVHDFKERLKFSEEASHEGFWRAVYSKAFPTMISMQMCQGACQGQQLGIDRIIQLQSGKTLRVDEKKRESEYADILLEYLSVDTTGAPGWIEKPLLIDYLAYAFMPTQRCYIFPWELLRRAWLHFKPNWHSWAKQRISGFQYVIADNGSYKTHSIAVPHAVLTKAIKDSMVIQL